MAPHAVKSAGAEVPISVHEDSAPAGPQSGIYSISTQYMTEQKLRLMLRTINSEDSRVYDDALEDKYRLKGVQLIDSVRENLQLPVRTFGTAATYYHRFRIRFPSSEYYYEDAALASLFVACKVEDTIKKSKEILCAAHNIRQPHDHKSSDDKIFESSSKFIVGLERHILETIGFDFRGQYPQKLLAKMVRHLVPKANAKEFLRVAYGMSIDLYKTFAPIKQTTATMVYAIFELTASLVGLAQDAIQAEDPRAWHTDRGCVIETMLDLLDLYTQFPKSTKVGAVFDLNRLMDIKIEINKVAEKTRLPRFDSCRQCASSQNPPPTPLPSAPAVLDVHHHHPITPGSATSPATTTTSLLSGSNSVKRPARTEGSIRFVFDADEARREQALVARYFVDEFEELEEEVDEVIREPEQPPHRQQQQQQQQQQPHPPQQAPRQPARSNNHPHRNNGGNHPHDRGWAPYHRNRHGPHGHGDNRHKGRKGHYNNY